MKTGLRATALVAFGMYSAAAMAADVSPQSFIGDKMRGTAGGVALRVSVAQSEIKSDINPSNIAVATGGGLFGALLGAAIDAGKAKKAEELITPLRNSLTGFDVDALAIDTAKAETADLSWVNATTPSFSKDTSAAGQSGFLDTINGDQLALVTFSYDLSPDFSSIRVVEHISIVHKGATNAQGAAIKPTDRLSYRNLDYNQSVTSVVTLAGSTNDKAANAALWAADGAKRARAVLTLGFGEVKRLTIRSLSLTPDNIKAMNSKENKRIVAGGFSGRQLAAEGTGTTTVWAPGFVSAQVLPDTVAQ
ncbi:MAG: hypothetical protein JWL96_1983 [Sphingomonas bacterium]|uniref:hypothetical protein n=1 Tax=Sphingomonas bacterium TaxID=1895847 RepID=UPI0026263654|nr:hypothetical protein [Sphingomonas bacterium]MDB5709913.1 hypothetical protein [Sphingomonas bacterium]